MRTEQEQTQLVSVMDDSQQVEAPAPQEREVKLKQ